MSLSVLPPAVLEWLKSQGAALLQAGRAERHPGFEPGRVYEGRVLQALPHGRHLVRVAGEFLDMALPQPAKSGDAIRLVYLKSEPRPTFLLVPEGPSPGAAPNVRVSDAALRIANLARWAGAGAAPPTPSPTAGAAPAAPSAAAGPAAVAAGTAGTPEPTAAAQTRALPAGLQAVPAETASAGVRPGPQAAALLPPGPLSTALSASSPAAASHGAPALLEAPSAEGAAWQAPLQQAVKQSGAFYEAHLARWVRGEMALADIRREPQARLAQAEWAGQARVAELGGMPEDAARLAGRQLAMLEGQPFVWQGPAWPGQWLQWQVEERPEGRGGEAEPPQWRTELRLTLPRLGAVAAEIALLPQGVRLRLNAVAPDTLAEIQAALPELAGRLEAAGLTVLGVAAELAAQAQPGGTGEADVGP